LLDSTTPANLTLMRTENSVVIDAPLAHIFDLAAHVERWPDIMPHYRSITLLRAQGDVRLCRMVATRTGFPFPFQWASVEEIDRSQHAIRFRQVRGITRGMRVEWTMELAPGGVRVRVTHAFDPPWPAPLGPLVAQHIIGDLFVHSIAAKTLQRIKVAAEASARAPVQGRQGLP